MLKSKESKKSRKRFSLISLLLLIPFCGFLTVLILMGSMIFDVMKKQDNMSDLQQRIGVMQAVVSGKEMATNEWQGSQESDEYDYKAVFYEDFYQNKKEWAEQKERIKTQSNDLRSRPNGMDKQNAENQELLEIVEEMRAKQPGRVY